MGASTLIVTIVVGVAILVVMLWMCKKSAEAAYAEELRVKAWIADQKFLEIDPAGGWYE